jgi:hypothetical protein
MRASVRAGILLVLCVLLAWFFLGTALGALLVVRSFAEWGTGVVLISPGEAKGNLAGGVVFTGVKALVRIPGVEGYRAIEAQECKVEPFSVFRPLPRISVRNARVFITGIQPVYCAGTFQGGEFRGTVFSDTLELGEIAGLYEPLHREFGIRGTVKGLDLEVYARGSMLRIRGVFLVEDASFRNFSVVSVPCTVSLEGRMDAAPPQWRGELAYRGGTLLAARTSIELVHGAVIFDGDIGKPSLALKGSAVVEGVKISLFLRGTLDAPELAVYSDPTYSREHVLLMLVTGKSWQQAPRPPGQPGRQLDLVKDFVDYLFLGGNAAKLTEWFGIKDISVQYDGQRQGIAVRKDILPGTDVTVGVSRSGSSVSAEQSSENKYELKIKKQF